MISKYELNILSFRKQIGFLFVLLLGVFALTQPLLASSNIESEISVVESEEALAKSEAARQESAEAQGEMEQEKLNSSEVISKAKAAILRAEQDEKRAINARLATEKYVATMKKKKAQMQAKKSLAEMNLKKATRALNIAEKQKAQLVDANTKLMDRNQEIAAQIKELSQQEKSLASEIRQLKVQQQKNMKFKKAMQMRLSESKARIKKLQLTKASFATRK